VTALGWFFLALVLAGVVTLLWAFDRKKGE